MANMAAPQASPLVDEMKQMPPNLVAELPAPVMKQIVQDLLQDYIFPQFLERRDYESQWDKLLDMYRLKVKRDKLTVVKESLERSDDAEIEVAVKNANDTIRVSDSLLFDTVDRLKNLNHFIVWKDGIPIKFGVSNSYNNTLEDEFYHPTANKAKQLNGLMQWNVDKEQVYRKSALVSQQHYLYGIAFVESEMAYEAAVEPTGKAILKDFSVTFDPVSIRKLWLNWRLPGYKMDLQPCPVRFEPVPRFAILQNQYDPKTNPFGYENLDAVAEATPQWLFSAQEAESWINAVKERNASNGSTMGEVLKPEYSVEASWKCFPMIALDPTTGEYKKRKDGTRVPLRRFILELFGTNILGGQVIPIRLQESFYPKDYLPLYSSSHIPDEDSGLYSLSIGEVLEHHYNEICTAMEQFLENKDLINDPPSWCVAGSPAATEDRNKKGANFMVSGPNDVGWRQVPDATGSTVSMLQFMREQAQQTSKAVDAIVGKAMGGRTSATEAQNVFQTAMSGVTTDINLFCFDIFGGYANRVKAYCSLWADTDLIRKITGFYGEPLSAEDLAANVTFKWDVGSSFIESIVKQQHLRYAIESATRSPVLRQDILWREFFRELRMPEMTHAIIDGGFSKSVQLATDQAIQTYLDRPVMINPVQDHQIAIEVKSRFLEDQESTWSREYGNLPYTKIQSPTPITRAQALIQQIEMHQQFALLQMQMQAAQMQQQQQAALPSPSGKDSGNIANQQMPTNPGQMAQGLA